VKPNFGALLVKRMKLLAKRGPDPGGPGDLRQAEMASVKQWARLKKNPFYLLYIPLNNHFEPYRIIPITKFSS